MHLYRVLSAGVTLAVAFTWAAPTAPTLRLPDTVAPVDYKVALTVDPAKPDFSGQIAIALDIKQATDLIWLDAIQINVEKASLIQGSKQVEATVVPGNSNIIGFQFVSPLRIGKATLTIQYRGKVRQQDSSGIFHMEDNSNSYLYTQFESTDARAAFPCFDEPSYKVPWQLTLSVPATDAAVSNTSATAEQTHHGVKTIAFAKTKPLPSYLVAFAVGPFDFVDAGKAGQNHIPVRIVTPKGHAGEAKYAGEVTATIIGRLESYFGIPFPYDKSDQVAIPVTFGFGAMENAGMVTYAQNIILAKADRDTEARRRTYASVAAHELAHQWFGDLVTTSWWNDIWLNEAFATWMEQKLIREWKPEWKTDIDDVDAKLYAEREDSLVSARKIRQEIASLNDISNAFDGITYQKGAAVISMFESYLGSEPFRKGVQGYLKQYAFRNASAPEFLDSISSASGKNITGAFSTFLNQAGVPLITASLECKDGTASLHLKQERYLPLGAKGPAEQRWKIPVCVRFGDSSRQATACEVMSDSGSVMKLAGDSCPAWVQVNDKARGYYRVAYSPEMRTALLNGNVQQTLSSAERVDFMGNAEALVDAGRLPLDASLDLVEKFHADPDLQVVESALTLALQPHTHLVPDALEPNYQRFLQANFKPLAQGLGWKPAANESDERRLLRPKVVRALATTGGDAELAKAATVLTKQWFADHHAIDPSMTAAALGTAAYYGDRSLEADFVDAFKKTTDRQERTRIIAAMRSFRDPAAIEANMQAVLSGGIPFIEGASLLWSGQTQESTRTLGFDFMKSHFDELAAKRPTGGGFDAGAEFPNVGASFCDSKNKSALQSFFRPRIDKFTGAPRALNQVLEEIDVCIATKEQQQPGVEKFLQKY